MSGQFEVMIERNFSSGINCAATGESAKPTATNYKTRNLCRSKSNNIGLLALSS